MVGNGERTVMSKRPSAPAQPRTLGLRERNKADKLQRIRHAARALFTESGYDRTTIREIARRADVGFGTLFTYASDKRDLLFLIFNDELAQVVDDAFRDALKSAPLLDQLIAFFRPFYRFFAQQPALSRFVLRELTFYVEGQQARQFQQARERLLRDLTALVTNARSAGRIASQEDPQLLARAIFSTYAAELRLWLADRPNLKSGLAQLRRMLRLQLEGFGPRKGAL